MPTRTTLVQGLPWLPWWLFPLDGAGGFGADVVDYAVYAGDFVYYPVGDYAQDFIGNLGPVCCHAVAAVYAAEGDNVVIGALVAHNPDGFDGEQHAEGLPDFIIEIGFF